MTDEQRIAAAEHKVDLARERVLDTLQSLAEQLEPRKLARELWEDAKVKGADLAEEAVDAVKARPIAATGVAAAVAMFLAREPIADLAGKLIGGKKGKKAAKPKPKASEKPTPPPKKKPMEKSDE
jgi:ElaB/YqjD/DUF883 family membrane-anchored ribosome-binding protein